MQATEHTQNILLDHLAFVVDIRDTLGSLNVLQALLTTSKKEWENSRDDSDDSHLIRNVALGSKKTDAVRVYVAKLVAQYLRSNGVRTTAWTKATISGDNGTNVAITNRITNMMLKDHTELFRLVMTRLLGFDEAIVDLTLVSSPKEKAKLLVAFIATRFDLAEDRIKALEVYGAAVEYFEQKFEEESFTPAFFIQASGAAIAYYSGDFSEAAPMVDKFDVMQMLDNAAGNNDE
jgi:hypothetical protein